MASSRKSIANLQILRGMAALSVIVVHASAQFPAAGSIPRLGAVQAGVDVFFVISGFIMVFVTASREQNGVDFLANRIVRIVPNYWVYTFLTALLAFVAPSVFRGTGFGLRHLILSLLFIAHRNPAIATSTSPILRTGWTLNYEMFFYLIFSIALIRRRHRVVITSVIISSFVILGLSIPHKDLVATFYTRDIMLEFVFGMLLALAYLRGLPKVSPAISIAACAAAIAIMISESRVAEDTHAIRSVFFGLPALAIVTSGLLLGGYESGPGSGLLRKIGDASYTIYLSHPFAVTGCRLLFVKLHLTPKGLLGEILFIVFTVAAAALGGYAAYRLIEMPLTQLGKLSLRHKRPKPVLATAEGS